MSEKGTDEALRQRFRERGLEVMDLHDPATGRFVGSLVAKREPPSAIDAGEPVPPAQLPDLGAAPSAKEPPPSLSTEPLEKMVEYAAVLYGITYPPGPLRTAAVVGAMLSRGLDAAACSALAVEQMGEALEERGQTAARLARGAADSSAELLAARLENEGLRAALKAARRAMVREVRELRHPNAYKSEYDSAHRLELAREAVDAVLLPADGIAGEG